jgi:hypothetical protein
MACGIRNPESLRNFGEKMKLSEIVIKANQESIVITTGIHAKYGDNSADNTQNDGISEAQFIAMYPDPEFRRKFLKTIGVGTALTALSGLLPLTAIRAFAHENPPSSASMITNEVKPLPDHVLAKLEAGRTVRTQILDGSMLEQHENLVPYAYTHVKMSFKDEADVIRCARMLHWSDERMRARTEPMIMWAWRRSYREKMTVEFTVGWYSEEFFNARKDAFLDTQHSSYYSKFGLTPMDIKTRNEILS